MLSPSEFTIGTLGSAAPLSLILPRTKYEATMLVGHVDKAPAAVFLSGEFAFHYFPSTDNDSWRGLIVPGVRVEVDETSVFDQGQTMAPLGAAIRIDTRLAIRAKSEHSLSGSSALTIHDKLVSAGDLRAGFTRWQIVIGEGQTKRVLWQRSDEDEAAKSSA
ncbi:conserved hypothetical 17.4 kDa protein (plasmid) [Sinorhizobium fredii NGR234]|uniref:Uncharacterized protein y4lG n=1 Tax=Sinorhizobium fredii (strain NBRC 101917 / NGR234) TaxID=394 RepID=Y4LG_SINFN|nr:hypothetical protein [Sinorhizobium fredii]P55547.1 RecName: Full=Uncharacterized protein y4lG [Sinorhizobium fredii NGR234]AAB91759.1 conserved hypothetical 17.4 kDa protein [Sinorhizobium fredii NGR234]